MRKCVYIFLASLFLSANAKAEFTDREAYLVSQLVDYCRAHQAYADIFLSLKFKGYQKQAIINSLSELDNLKGGIIDKAYARDVQESEKDEFIESIVSECYDEGLELLTSGKIK
ncbi:hypothetical protein [Marinobacter sp. S0848L]|uniref:hypothetical protein n=1 Tax=Marinobacter sp. S0848L TaxID=2926423 RepID=UPI001FF1B989|nr:hypothetical protein [Marinobacter sp. S0848L]MCK0106956.1 hypothetical protein [Marinobacter sp. S0848L]